MAKLWKVVAEFAVVLNVWPCLLSVRHDIVLACWEVHWLPQNGFWCEYSLMYFTFMWPCIVTNFFVIIMVYIIQTACEQGWQAVYKPVWHIPLLSVQWINSWWWTDELSETGRVSCQNKFVKLVHLVGFLTQKQFNVLGGGGEATDSFWWLSENESLFDVTLCCRVTSRKPKHLRTSCVVTVRICLLFELCTVEINLN
jgi:hypothetical protein